MRIDLSPLCRAVASIAAVALAAGLAGCDANVSVDGDKGQKLSELDMSGTAPTKLVLAGPDHVKITEGAKLAISVDGDAQGADQLRFTLKDGTLGVLRPKNWSQGSPVTVNITMPAPQSVMLAGSGSIDTPALGANAEVTLAGSGDLDAGTISGDSFKLNLAGSGTIRGGGAVRSLDMNIAGSGSANLAALRADSAKIMVAGSGDATMMSDGTVKASIMGSGTVTVKGRATCKVSSMGSGKLVCESGEPVKVDE